MVHTAKLRADNELAHRYLKQVKGEIRITDGKDFGFLGDAFVHPLLIKKHHLKAGMYIEGGAFKSYDPKSEQWKWRMFRFQS